MIISRKGFTLIELLAVIVIMMILVSLGFVGANIAVKNAKTARAKAEVRDISKAWQVYWGIFGEWPFGNTERDMDSQAVKELQGKGDVNDQYVLMDIGVGRSSGLKDPWGNVYKVDFDSISNSNQVEYYETVVMLPNRNRFRYE